jgi:hypothetical protein
MRQETKFLMRQETKFFKKTGFLKGFQAKVSLSETFA